MTRQGIRNRVLTTLLILGTNACGDEDDTIEGASGKDLDADSAADSGEPPWYIVHAVSQPAPPECMPSKEDPAVSTGLLDLSLGTAHSQFFLMRNALESQGDSLKAQANGIFIDGSEVSLSAEEGESLGTISALGDGYIDPETSKVAFAELISDAQGEALATQYNCLPMNSGNYSWEEIPSNGDNPAGGILATIRVEVSFFGHSNSDTFVETPPFDFDIRLCCGCLVSWAECTSACDAYCTPPEGSGGTCTDGVGNGDERVDCRQYYYNPTATWDGQGTCSDNDGSTRPCDCGDCGI